MLLSLKVRRLAQAASAGSARTGPGLTLRWCLWATRRAGRRCSTSRKLNRPSALLKRCERTSSGTANRGGPLTRFNWHAHMRPTGWDGTIVEPGPLLISVPRANPTGRTRRQDGFGSVLIGCLNTLVFPPSFARGRRRGADHARERQCGPDIASRPSRGCDCHADGRAVRIDDMSIR